MMGCSVSFCAQTNILRSFSNFMVRKAVGSTPAIMGNKIKQSYIQGERFFELMIDTGSSSVANGVMRICNGECWKESFMQNAADLFLPRDDDLKMFSSRQ